MRIRDYFLLFILLLCDVITKLYVVLKLELGQKIEVIKDFFYITPAHNTGAAWSMLAGKISFFIIVAGIAVLIIAIYFGTYRVKNGLQRFALLLVLAGTVGNMIDRIAYGYVIDFLDFYIFGYDFPIFNVADSFLTVGVVLIILDMFIFHKEQYGEH